MKKIFMIGLVLSILLSCFSLVLSYNCGDEPSVCLNEHKPDLFWHANTVGFIQENGSFPVEVNHRPSGEFEPLEMWHSPLYYYIMVPLAGFLGSFIGFHLALYVWSILIIGLAGFVAYLIFRKISVLIKDKLMLFYSSLLLLFLPTHLYLSTIVNNDVLYYLLSLLVVYFYIRYLVEKNYVNAALLGFFIGLSVLSRLAGILFIVSSFVYIAWLILCKKWLEVKHFLVVLAFAFPLSVVPFLRNYLVFGGQVLAVNFVNGLANPYNIIRVWLGYWGGARGGFYLTKPILKVFIAGLCLVFVYSIKDYIFRIRRRINLDYILIIMVVLGFLTIHWTCDIFSLIFYQKCIGLVAAQNRYLSFMNFGIALFSSFILSKFTRKYSKIGWLIISLFIVFLILLGLEFITSYIFVFD